MSLCALPEELLLRVCELVDPGLHLNLALVDRRHANICRPILERHRRYRRELYSWSNYLPPSQHKLSISSLITDLLRRIVFDPIAAWHVRRLDLWIDQNFRKALGETDVTEVSPVPEVKLSTHLDPNLLAKGHLIYDRLCAPGLKLPFTGQTISNGNIEAQLVALVALCPRLNFLKVNELGSENGSRDGIELNNSDYFCNIILGIREIPQPNWPPGFRSLRKLSFGVDKPDYTPIQCQSILPVFLLPKLETISLCGLCWEGSQGDDDDMGFSLRPSSSSVKNIMFSTIGTDPIKRFVGNVIEGCKELSTVVFGHCDFDDFDITVRQLWKHGSTLETLIFCTAGAPTGYRCNTFRPEDLSSDFQKLKTLTLDMEDVRLDSLYQYNFGPKDEGLSGNVTGHDNFVKYFNENMIPESVSESLETLIFQVPEYDWFRLNTKDKEAIGDALGQFLARDFPTLKSVFIDKIAAVTVENPPRENEMPPWALQAANIGRDHGVSVHTTAQATDHHISGICDRTFGFIPKSLNLAAA